MATIGHQDGSVTLWNLRQRQILCHTKLHNGEVRGVSYSGEGRFLASAGYDNKIMVVDTADPCNLEIVKTLDHEDKVVSVRWHPFMPILCSTSADKSARIWCPFGEMIK